MQTFLDFTAFQNNTEPVYARELSLSYRSSVNLWNPSDFQINSSKKLDVLLRKIWDKDHITIKESFYLLCFSASLELVGFSKVSDGGLDAVLVDLRLLFSIALLSRSTSIIVAHNHPSGTLRPSQADKDLTSRLVKAGSLLNIDVNDHIILTENSYFSFRDEGLL